MRQIILRMKNFKSIAFCLLLAVTIISCTQEKEQEPEKNFLLLISFDGFKYDYFERANTPNFDKFIAGGAKADGLIPVFPTKTFPNHYSIVTGLYPENSGIVSNTMYDKEIDKYYRIGDREAVENPAWYQGEPIWNTAERQGLTAGTLFWVGSEAPINGKYATYWKIYDTNMDERARIDTVVNWFTQTDKPNVDFATLYFSEVDTQGHGRGPNADSVNVYIEQADELLGYLVDRLEEKGIYDRTNIVIVSDHGMSELSADRVFLIDQIIDVTRVQMVDWTPVSMINFTDSTYKDEAIAKLKEAEKENGNFRVFTKEEIPDYWHVKNHPRTTDLIVVADNGWQITSRNRLNFFIQGLPAGTHGFDNQEKDMQGIFLAHGPNIAEGTKIEAFENVHIYEMMCELLGIEPAKNDGNIEILKLILR